MPTVTLNGYTQFIQKITLTRLLRATLGVGLKQAKDEVEQLLRGKVVHVAFGSLGEAQAFLYVVTSLGVLATILDESGAPLLVEVSAEPAPAPESANDEAAVTVGATWVMWGVPAAGERVAPEDEVKARQILRGCQVVVDALAAEIANSSNDSEELAENERFTDWLRSLFDLEAITLLAADRTDVVTTPALTAFGMYLALSQHGKVFAALRCL